MAKLRGTNKLSRNIFKDKTYREAKLIFNNAISKIYINRKATGPNLNFHKEILNGAIKDIKELVPGKSSKDIQRLLSDIEKAKNYILGETVQVDLIKSEKMKLLISQGILSPTPKAGVVTGQYTKLPDGAVKKTSETNYTGMPTADEYASKRTDMEDDMFSYSDSANRGSNQFYPTVDDTKFANKSAVQPNLDWEMVENEMSQEIQRDQYAAAAEYLQENYKLNINEATQEQLKTAHNNAEDLILSGDFNTFLMGSNIQGGLEIALQSLARIAKVRESEMAYMQVPGDEVVRVQDAYDSVPNGHVQDDVDKTFKMAEVYLSVLEADRGNDDAKSFAYDQMAESINVLHSVKDLPMDKQHQLRELEQKFEEIKTDRHQETDSENYANKYNTTMATISAEDSEELSQRLKQLDEHDESNANDFKK